jgi:uncharacterized protein (DUF302 family)
MTEPIEGVVTKLSPWSVADTVARLVAAPLAALDLPLKVLVWADGGQTKVGYFTAPRALAARYGLGDDLAARLAGIDAVTDAVIDR